MVSNFKVMSQKQFKMLSWTWGFLMSCIGLLAVLVIKLVGAFTKTEYKLKKHGYCYYLSVGKGWGGVNLGYFFITDARASDSTKWHEHGHAVQNCYLGLLMPFVVGIPSFIRYQKFNANIRKGIPNKEDYDAIWFEGDATATGLKYKSEIGA